MRQNLWLLDALETAERERDEARATLGRVGSVLSERGCECDVDGEHDGTCEEMNHDACYGCAVQDALVTP